MKLTNPLLPFAALLVFAATGCSESPSVDRPRLLSADAARGNDLARLEELSAAEAARVMPARFDVECPPTERATVRID